MTKPLTHSKCHASVRWGSAMSQVFKVTAGVRQGGILSPFLFAIYIDDMVNELKQSKLGCCVNKQYLGVFLYADDILLISQSVTCMQEMLNLCFAIATKLDMRFNSKKSVVLRIGKRYKKSCDMLQIGGEKLNFVTELRYLGVYLLTGNQFRCTFVHNKLKFYKCFNAVYSKSQSGSSELIAVQLLKSYCMPLFLYACEAISPSASDIKLLDRLINTALFKIFKTFNMDVVTDIRHYLNLPPVKEIISCREFKFATKFASKSLSFNKTMLSMNDYRKGLLYK